MLENKHAIQESTFLSLQSKKQKLEFVTQIKPSTNQVSDTQQAKHYDQSEMPEKPNILKYEKELSIHNLLKQIYGYKFHVHMHQTVKINYIRAVLLQSHSCCTEMIRTVRTLRTHRFLSHCFQKEKTVHSHL